MITISLQIELVEWATVWTRVCHFVYLQLTFLCETISFISWKCVFCASNLLKLRSLAFLSKIFIFVSIFVWLVCCCFFTLDEIIRTYASINAADFQSSQDSLAPLGMRATFLFPSTQILSVSLLILARVSLLHNFITDTLLQSQNGSFLALHGLKKLVIIRTSMIKTSYFVKKKNCYRKY